MSEDHQWVSAHEEQKSDGTIIGKDPMKIPKHELSFMGIRPMELIDVIRERCIDCKSTELNISEAIRNCRAIKCAAWPYRMANNPFKPNVIRKPIVRKKKRVKSKNWYYP